MARGSRLLAGAAAAFVLASVPALPASAHSFTPRFGTITTIASTVPANGDLNPYGVAVVPRTVGALTKGNILVSNFNASSNLQGTGTTIVQISPSGSMSLFAQIDPHHLPGPCPGGVGLTTALVALRAGWVIVGSLPTTDGSASTAKAGCLLVLDSSGGVVETFAGRPINGPWDMTALDEGDQATLFETNVLNGTVAGGGQVVDRGTVVRIELSLGDGQMPSIESEVVIGSTFGERTDPAALVVGPTGVGLASSETLYVADSVANRVTAIPDAVDRESSAGTGATVTSGGSLNTPLGLTVRSGGDILTVNAGDGNLVETSPSGRQLATITLDSTGNPPGAGTLFGIALTPDGTGLYFVDDGSNTLNLVS